MPLLGKTFALLLVFCSAFGVELDVNSSTKQVAMGEPFTLTYTFVHTKKEAIVDFRFAAPELAHFKVLDSRSESSSVDKREVWKKQYTLVPLQNGEVSTGPAAMNVARRVFKKDAWGQWMPVMQWEVQRFEPVAVFATPVPSAVQAIGDFGIRAVTDRNETDDGQPIRLMLRLKGCGALGMAEPLRLSISGVSVFDEGQTENAQWRQGCYSSERNQTFALVADRDYTIPAVTFRSFDPVQGKVVTAQTLPIPVRVRPVPGTAQMESRNKGDEMSIIGAVAGALGGFGLGVGATLLYLRRDNRRRRVRYDSLRAALIELFRHLDDPDAKKSAEAVEKHLYEGAEAPDMDAISNVLNRLRGTSGNAKEER